MAIGPRSSTRANRHRVRLRPVRRGRPFVSPRARDRPRPGGGRFCGHDRGWTGYHGSGQPGSSGRQGPSVGCNITLPHEQEPNPYLDEFTSIISSCARSCWSSTRSGSCAARRIRDPGRDFRDPHPDADGQDPAFPCIGVGKAFWQPLVDFVLERLFAEGTVGTDEVAIEPSDSADDVVAHPLRAPCRR